MVSVRPASQPIVHVGKNLNIVIFLDPVILINMSDFGWW